MLHAELEVYLPYIYHTLHGSIFTIYLPHGSGAEVYVPYIYHTLHKEVVQEAGLHRVGFRQAGFVRPACGRRRPACSALLRRLTALQSIQIKYKE